MLIAAIEIARVAHEVNRAYCRAIGDDSQVPWEDAAQWQKDSAFAGASMILNDPSVTPEQSHDAWMEQKFADGWTYGKVKDATAKTHPDLVAYDELPTEQKAKDFIFGAVVRALRG